MSEPSSQSNRKRVLIVDDHPITRAGLVQLIDRQPDLQVCGEADSASKALSALNTCAPDLVVVEITLPDKSGLELIKDITSSRPTLPILVSSIHDESLYAERALRAGARGYITKRESGERLMQAIRCVGSGNIYLSESISDQMLQLFSVHSVRPSSPIQKLSDREFEVFRLIGAGLSTQEIATKLHLRAKTVKAHRANVKRKLNLRTMPKLISYAARWLEK